MTYDKAKYHFEGDFPSDLPDEQAYLHAGMFLGWLCAKSLVRAEFREDFEDEISRFERGELNCASLFRLVGGVLADDMLSNKVIPFVDFYYGEKRRYFVDYADVFSGHATIYHVTDNTENFRKLSKRLNERFEKWQADSKRRSQNREH
jgi:hypothetical protein